MHLQNNAIGDRKRQGGENENKNTFDSSKYGMRYARWAVALHWWTLVVD